MVSTRYSCVFVSCHPHFSCVMIFSVVMESSIPLMIVMGLLEWWSVSIVDNHNDDYNHTDDHNVITMMITYNHNDDHDYWCTPWSWRPHHDDPSSWRCVQTTLLAESRLISCCHRQWEIVMMRFIISEKWDFIIFYRWWDFTTFYEWWDSLHHHVLSQSSSLRDHQWWWRRTSKRDEIYHHHRHSMKMIRWTLPLIIITPHMFILTLTQKRMIDLLPFPLAYCPFHFACPHYSHFLTHFRLFPQLHRNLSFIILMMSLISCVLMKLSHHNWSGDSATTSQLYSVSDTLCVLCFPTQAWWHWHITIIPNPTPLCIVDLSSFTLHYITWNNHSFHSPTTFPHHGHFRWRSSDSWKLQVVISHYNFCGYITSDVCVHTCVHSHAITSDVDDHHIDYDEHHVMIIIYHRQQTHLSLCVGAEAHPITEPMCVKNRGTVFSCCGLNHYITSHL